MCSTATVHDETRQGLGTLKKGKLNRKLIGNKPSPLAKESHLTTTEEEPETVNTSKVEKEEDPVLSRRRRPNVVMREGYNLGKQKIHFSMGRLNSKIV